MGLAEEIYEDQENTDSLKTPNSVKVAPFILSVGFVRNPSGDDSVIIDCDDVELQCVDQVLHLAVDSKMRIHAMEQSRGSNYQWSPGYLNIKYLNSENLIQIVKPKINELDIAVSRMIDI